MPVNRLTSSLKTFVWLADCVILFSSPPLPTNSRPESSHE